MIVLSPFRLFPLTKLPNMHLMWYVSVLVCVCVCVCVFVVLTKFRCVVHPSLCLRVSPFLASAEPPRHGESLAGTHQEANGQSATQQEELEERKCSEFVHNEIGEKRGGRRGEGKLFSCGRC